VAHWLLEKPAAQRNWCKPAFVSFWWRDHWLPAVLSRFRLKGFDFQSYL
jgi:hypothetical protein